MRVDEPTLRSQAEVSGTDISSGSSSRSGPRRARVRTRDAADAAARAYRPFQITTSLGLDAGTKFVANPTNQLSKLFQGDLERAARKPETTHRQAFCRALGVGSRVHLFA